MDGVYHQFGAALAGVIAREEPDIKIKVVTTAGSRENMRLLGTGEVDLALVQDDTPGALQARSIAPLYKEYLHILVRQGVQPHLSTIDDLRGRPVSVGPAGSGTSAVAAAVLKHFGLVDSAVSVERFSSAEVEAAFTEGRIDAAFILSALPSPVVDRIARSGGGILLSLGAGSDGGTPADGLVATDPRFAKALIPERSYGLQPRVPVHTVAVNSILVASAKVPDDAVRRIAQVLFNQRIALAEHQPLALRLREPENPNGLRYPLHPGAAAYYERDEPPFLIRYAEAIGLSLSVAAGLLSGFLGLRQWYKRSRKENIDDYYDRVTQITSGLATADADTLQSVALELHELRRQAFRDLTGERLQADESFTIFQDYLRSELSAIDSRLKSC